MSNPHKHEPFDVYVMDISYFSGKFEAYLRYKEIPYRRTSVNHHQLHEVFRQTGTMKVPAVRSADGLWLKDTTPMIAWFEQEYPTPAILPQEPALGFVARLLEDYADEWLWRPAMWWRWEPKVSREALGRRIAQEVLAGFPAPKWLLRPYFVWRQRRTWLWGDGMTKANSPQVREMYLLQLDALEAILQRQPYLLGSHPSLADFGYFGPFFRHFSNDPDSGEVMRQRGPAVYEWTARLWNAKGKDFSQPPRWEWPSQEAWKPIWTDLCSVYLPYLHQNALAWQKGAKRFDFSAGGTQFRGSVTTRYRVWCRQELQRRWAALEETAQTEVQELLAPFGGLAALHTDGEIDAGLDADLTLPFAPRPPKSWLASARAWAFGTARDAPPHST